MSKNTKTRNMLKSVSPMKLILGGYCMIILLGTLLLSLPIATNEGVWTPVTDCFFTATSATCVTGLIRYDTFTHWSLFGQVVIISLIQVGGVGFMTIGILALLLIRKKISIGQRSLMQNSISAPHIGGIVHMTKFIAGATLCIEAAGAVLLAFDFVPRFGWKQGIYFAVFHSISAFCNAGFDLMGGTYGPFASLTGLQDNWYVNSIIMLLIFIGGLGFFVWYDLGTKRFRFRQLNLQSKVVLTVSIGLVFAGAAALFITERSSAAYAGFSMSDRILASLFQSVSPRTAGFNTVNFTEMSEAGIFIMTLLMFVGGSTGSTAGGIKTTTFAILCISICATFGRKKHMEAFGRRMDEGVIRTAACIFMTYFLMTSAVAVVISAMDGVPMLDALFESVSAMATVGLTTGITPSLSMVPKLLLAFLMLCGRVGSVTMLLAFSNEKKPGEAGLPLENVQVG